MNPNPSYQELNLDELSVYYEFVMKSHEDGVDTIKVTTTGTERALEQDMIRQDCTIDPGMAFAFYKSTYRDTSFRFPHDESIMEYDDECFYIHTGLIDREWINLWKKRRDDAFLARMTTL